jgi:aspartate kinase
LDIPFDLKNKKYKQMKVWKFGGTSVGSAERIKKVVQLICDGEQKLVVLSAMAGVTNQLADIAKYLSENNQDAASENIRRLEKEHIETVSNLFTTEKFATKAKESVYEITGLLHSLVNEIFTSREEWIILAQGELLSTEIVCLYLQEKGVKVFNLPALDYMKIDGEGEPDMKYIRTNLNHILEKHSGIEIYITQGYICRNAHGEIDNLQRGGSDYTASLVGAALLAEEIQIWTDINGIHNNDPRYVEGTKSIEKLNFDEAAELAYFGAKILHPTCILPAKINNIPVRLLNSLEPQDKGTLISNESVQGTIKAIAAKDNITAIKIQSGRMLLAYGFLRKVFEIFELYETPIDMITTSEVGVSLTVDNTRYLDKIVSKLKKYGAISIDENMVIICVVGNLQWENIGLASQVIEALREIPVRMISYGGSNHNVSLLVKAEDKKRALEILNRKLF